MPKKRSFFIVFEGIDGSGLSTHSARLKDWLANQGYSVILSAEPTDGPIGALIRLVLKDMINIGKRPDVLALLYAADRLYHIHELPYGMARDEARKGIRNALRDGKVVISNRYLLSSLAYQSVPAAGLSLDMEWIEKINHPLNSTDGMPSPDLVVYLDVPPKFTMERISLGRQRYELFESHDYLEKVYERFNDVLSKTPWPVARIHGVTTKGRIKTIDEVQKEIHKRVENVIFRGENPGRKLDAKPVAGAWA